MLSTVLLSGRCPVHKKSPQKSVRKWYFFFGGGGGGEENTKHEEKSLKPGNQYHVTVALGSNLTYLAIPEQVSMCVKLFLGTPGMPPKNYPSELKLFWLYLNAWFPLQPIMLFS